MDNTLRIRLLGLFGAVLVLSAVTLVVAAVVGSETPVWIRGTIVAVIAVVLVLLANRAAAGSRGAYKRMLIMTIVAPIAVAAIVAIPHDGFPLWMKVEQSVVGLLLLGAAVLAGRRGVRQAYRSADGR